MCYLCFLQVRYARSHQYVQAGSGPEDNRQLFFAHAPVSATQQHMKELFGRFGQVRLQQLASYAGSGQLQRCCVHVVLRTLKVACVLKLATAVALRLLLLLLQVEEVNLFSERRTHVSKGCGFVTMHTREQAIAVRRLAAQHCHLALPCSWLPATCRQCPQQLCYGAFRQLPSFLSRCWVF
jgi:hypothetical protein